MWQAVERVLSPPPSPHTNELETIKRALEAALLRATEAEDEAIEARLCSVRMGEMALAERDRADAFARELARERSNAIARAALAECAHASMPLSLCPRCFLKPVESGGAGRRGGSSRGSPQTPVSALALTLPHRSDATFETMLAVERRKSSNAKELWPAQAPAPWWSCWTTR